MSEPVTFEQFHAADWPHGLRCAKCKVAFIEGEYLHETLDSMAGDMPVVVIVCGECDRMSEREDGTMSNEPKTLEQAVYDLAGRVEALEAERAPEATRAKLYMATVEKQQQEDAEYLAKSWWGRKFDDWFGDRHP